MNVQQSAQEIRDAAREQVQAQREALRAQAQAQREAIRAQVDAQREAVRAQIEAQRSANEAARTGTTVQIPPIPPLPQFPGNSDIPAGAVILGVTFFVAAAVTIIFAPLVRAFARRIDRRSSPATENADTTARLERIEQAVEAISIEVERISEGQRFTNQVMNEMRSLPQGSAPAEPVRVRTKEELNR